jgi:hypothetical protein
MMALGRSLMAEAESMEHETAALRGASGSVRALLGDASNHFVADHLGPLRPKSAPSQPKAWSRCEAGAVR